MFDIMVRCDMTDYFRLKQEDIELTGEAMGMADPQSVTVKET